MPDQPDDYYRIDSGTIEEITKREIRYSVTEYPTLYATIEKSVEYHVRGIHKDTIQIKENGKYVELPEEIDFSKTTIWERFKLIASMLYNIFDNRYWQKHVDKQQYLNEDNEYIGALREKVDEYNDLLEKYIKADCTKFTKDKKKNIEARKKNLDGIVMQIEIRKQLMRRK